MKLLTYFRYHPISPDSLLFLVWMIASSRGHLLPSVLFRLGLLATLRSKKLDGKAVGVMITASHNPAEVSHSNPHMLRVSLG